MVPGYTIGSVAPGACSMVAPKRAGTEDGFVPFNKGTSKRLGALFSGRPTRFQVNNRCQDTGQLAGSDSYRNSFCFLPCGSWADVSHSRSG